MQTETEFEGIPRNQITWNPTINYQECTSCGKCVEFCKRSVFGRQAEKVIVEKPNNCKVYCKNCQKQCPNTAITHPLEEETKSHIKQLQESKA